MKKSIKNAAVALVIGGATFGAVKGCEHIENVENEEINKEFVAEHPDADSIVADAAHNRFYAEKKADTKKIKEINKEIKTLEEKRAELFDSLVKQQQKDDEIFLKACKTGKKEDVENILKRANMNVTDKDGNTGLMLALKYNDSLSAQAIATFLLKQYGIDVFQKNKDGVDVRDLVGYRMSESATWSLVKEAVVAECNRGKGAIYNYKDDKSFLYGSSEKRALSNKIVFYNKKIEDLRQKEDIYSGYLFDAKDNSIDISSGPSAMNDYKDGIGKEVKSELKDNVKKRKKGQKIENIDKKMDRWD